MRNIQTIALEDIYKQHIGGSIPILVDIYNPDIVWKDNSLEQDAMYLRVINDTTKVKFNGKRYLPCKFDFEPPEETGTSTGNATITISNLDSRVTQMLRTCELVCEVTVVASYVKETDNKFKFIPINKYKFNLNGSSYTRVTAQLNLVNDNILNLNIPRDTANQNQLPSVNANENS